MLIKALTERHIVKLLERKTVSRNNFHKKLGTKYATYFYM